MLRLRPALLRRLLWTTLGVARVRLQRLARLWIPRWLARLRLPGWFARQRNGAGAVPGLWASVVACAPDDAERINFG